jgi:hypothetical protein
LKVLNFIAGVVCATFAVATFWSMIDGDHLGSLKSIGGMLGLGLMIVMIWGLIGDARQFSVRIARGFRDTFRRRRP